MNKRQPLLSTNFKNTVLLECSCVYQALGYQITDSDLVGLGWGLDSAFLRSSQVLLLLLEPELHFEWEVLEN